MRSSLGSRGRVGSLRNEWCLEQTAGKKLSKLTRDKPGSGEQEGTASHIGPGCGWTQTAFWVQDLPGQTQHLTDAHVGAATVGDLTNFCQLKNALKLHIDTR